MEFYLGEILLLPFNFAPVGTLDCDGRLLAIGEYEALFTLIGTTYGGDGISTFALPDLRSRTPIGIGQKPGLSTIQLGQASGVENISLLQSNLPAHVHAFSSTANFSLSPKASSVIGTTSDPTNAIWANSDDGSGQPVGLFTAPSNADVPMATMNATLQIAGNTAVVGNNVPVPIRNPFLGLRYVITTEGIYPSQS